MARILINVRPDSKSLLDKLAWENHRSINEQAAFNLEERLREIRSALGLPEDGEPAVAS